MLNFPDAPTTNQVFTAVGKSWQWDGVKWLSSTVVGAVSGDDPPILVTTSTTLVGVIRATVNVSNGTGAVLVITLPAATVTDQTYRFKDIVGNASTFPIRILPTAGTIDGKADFYMFQDYQAAELYWAGLWCVR